LLRQEDSEADLSAEELAQPQVQSFVHAVHTCRPHLISALLAVIVLTGFAICSSSGGSGHAQARNFIGLNDADTANKTLMTPKMFQLTLTDSQEPKWTEVKFEKANLKSDAVFMVETGKLTSGDSVYLWLGRDAKKPLTTKASTASSDYLKTTKYKWRGFAVIFEGKRMESEFLALFEGEGGSETESPQMFKVTLEGEDDPVLNHVPFKESLLKSDEVFIVDTGGEDTLDTIYLWLGRDATPPLTTTARDVCSDYIKTTQHMHRATTIVFEGKRMEGPFLKLFDDADDGQGGESESESKEEGGVQHGGAFPVHGRALLSLTCILWVVCWC